ncbi:MAG: ketoacyl-ACP synthase III [Desulfobacteraceae bacterium]|nr:ketoacyl-ACP synthase III [Desulfobacteraceae bacterium]
MANAASITGIGSAFPKTIVSNDDIAAKLKKLGLETNDKWIRDRTGICERRYSDLENADERNSSLGLAAAVKALEMAGKSPQDIDQIIYATCTPDTPILSTACWLQHKLGAPKAWTMDLNAACSGFLYGLTVAEQFLITGKSKLVLVIGAEVLHPFVNWYDRGSCILFGDGAGAAVVEQTDEGSRHRILSSQLQSDGNLWELLYVPAGGSNIEITPEVYAQHLHKIKMSGREIFKIAVRTLSDFAVRALEAGNSTINDLDWFIPHQANRRIIEAVANRLDIPMDKVLINIDRYGNTSSATIPTMIDEAVQDGRIKKGDLLLLDAFGAGLTYGSVLLRW